MALTLLHDLLDHRTGQTPRARAVGRSGRWWTYAELHRRSLAAADWLHGHGVLAGDRILILDDNQPETVALVAAASRVGAIYVIVSDRARPYYLRHVLADCSPAIVIGGAEAAARVAALTTVPVHEFADLPEIPEPGPVTRPTVLPIDPVSLIYTSGSTALPKAVVCTHQQILFAVDAIAGRLGYRADDVVLCCLPLSFDYGLYQTFLSWEAGACLVLGSEAEAGAMLLRRVVDEAVSVLPVVPSLAVNLCRLLNRAAANGAADPPPRLRLITNTGAPLPPSLCAQVRTAAPGVAVVAMFGLTECKRVSVAEPDLDLVRPGSVGRPLPGTEVFAVDPHGNRLPAGEVGELVVRGPHVMAGYWGAPELTAARFRRDYLGRTALHTGDYGHLDADGYLYFAGRTDDVYKQNGFRVSTTEIEAVAMDIDGVDLAVAFAPDGPWGARLAVGGTITPEQLTKELLARLESPRMPKDCRVLDALPLNANGKVDRRAVREQWN